MNSDIYSLTISVFAGMVLTLIDAPRLVVLPELDGAGRAQTEGTSARMGPELKALRNKP